jgi:hypothetical protein
MSTPASIAPGQRQRDRGDGTRERPPQAGRDDEQRGQQIGAHHRRIAAGRNAAADEQRGARRGPGDGNRLPCGDGHADAEKTHDDRDGEQAGRCLSFGSADRAEPGKHDRHRAGKTDDGRQHAGKDWLRQGDGRGGWGIGHGLVAGRWHAVMAETVAPPQEGKGAIRRCRA